MTTSVAMVPRTQFSAAAAATDLAPVTTKPASAAGGPSSAALRPTSLANRAPAISKDPATLRFQIRSTITTSVFFMAHLPASQATPAKTLADLKSTQTEAGLVKFLRNSIHAVDGMRDVPKLQAMLAKSIQEFNQLFSVVRNAGGQRAARLNTALGKLQEASGQTDGKGEAFTLLDVDAALKKAGISTGGPAQPGGRKLLAPKRQNLKPLLDEAQVKKALAEIAEPDSRPTVRQRAIDYICKQMESYIPDLSKEAGIFVEATANALRALAKILPPHGPDLVRRMEPLLRAMLQGRLVRVVKNLGTFEAFMISVNGESNRNNITIEINQKYLKDSGKLARILFHELFHAVFDGVRETSLSHQLLNTRPREEKLPAIAKAVGLPPDQAGYALQRIFQEAYTFSAESKAFPDPTGMRKDIKFLLDAVIPDFLHEALNQAKSIVPSTELTKHPPPWREDPHGANLVQAFQWLHHHPKVFWSTLNIPRGKSGTVVDDRLTREAPFARWFASLSKTYDPAGYTTPLHDELRR